MQYRAEEEGGSFASLPPSPPGIACPRKHLFGWWAGAELRFPAPTNQNDVFLVLHILVTRNYVSVGIIYVGGGGAPLRSSPQQGNLPFNSYVRKGWWWRSGAELLLHHHILSVAIEM